MSDSSVSTNKPKKTSLVCLVAERRGVIILVNMQEKNGSVTASSEILLFWTLVQDNVFVTVVCSVQYRIVRQNADDAFYELQNPREQIQAYVFDGRGSSCSPEPHHILR